MSDLAFRLFLALAIPVLFLPVGIALHKGRNVGPVIALSLAFWPAALALALRTRRGMTTPPLAPASRDRLGCAERPASGSLAMHDPHQDTPHQDTPHQDTPHQDTPHQDTPHQDTPHQDTPHQDTPHQDTPHQDTPHQDTPHRDTPYDGTPHGHSHDAEAPGAVTERWKHDGVRVIPGDKLDANTAQTPGMVRQAAINHARVGAQKIWAGTVAIEPDAKTGVHHHGALESVIFVLSGRARMRWGDRLEYVAEAGPGDFIFVPPYVPHQEINASPDETLQCVLVRSDNEAVVVNIPDVEPVERPEAVHWVDPIHKHP